MMSIIKYFSDFFFGDPKVFWLKNLALRWDTKAYSCAHIAMRAMQSFPEKCHPKILLPLRNCAHSCDVAGDADICDTHQRFY